MEMTFQQYIDNPMGRRNAAFSQRDMYRALYTDKYDKLFLREAGKINFALYVDEKNDRYVAHIKIPSETVKNFYYDAVIMFYATDAAPKSSSSLQNYYVKFFSNDPAFVFTYLRVFLKNDLFFEDLKSKSSKLALTKDPKITNPYEVPGYCKVLYFAFLFMKSKNLFAKHMYTSYGKKYNRKAFVNTVEHTDIKIAERQRLGEEEARNQALAKREERKATRASTYSDQSDAESSNTAKGVRTTRSTNVISKTKSVNMTKRTSTVKRTTNKK